MYTCVLRDRRRFHGHYFTFSKEIGFRACVYHHRMKPKVGRNFTSERGGGGGGVKGEVKNIWLQLLASRYF